MGVRKLLAETEATGSRVGVRLARRATDADS
jgi:hypothetical protein